MTPPADPPRPAIVDPSAPIRADVDRDDPCSTPDTPLDGGDFSAWLDRARDALRSGAGADVPCGTCTACCRSSLFIHVDAGEKDVLAHVPKALRFPAPGSPKGAVVLGYDELGRCPMLRGDGCSIYAHRPATCRDFDCRVLAACGLAADRDDDGPIARQARRWVFRLAAPADLERHAALRRAVRFLRANARLFAPGFVPPNAIQRAALAVAVLDAFLDRSAATDTEIAGRVREAAERFRGSRDARPRP